MSNLVIVALPERDDRVWKVSSEKVPHLTLLFLGENTEDVPKLQRIIEFVQHAVDVSEHGPFMLDVDRRDVLGPDQADVVHFRKDWSFKWINQFRNQLLQNTDIKTAYESVHQYPEWLPHLTLGYPETPANDDAVDHPIHWVSFDRIAVWTGDYEGPEFRLAWPERQFEEGVMSMSTMAQTLALGAEFLEHYGVKGMRWGVRREPPTAVAPSASSHVPHGEKRKTKIQVEGGENHPAHEDAIKVAEARVKLAKSGTAALSNQELREVAQRLQLEAQVQQLTASKGKKFVTSLLKTQGTNEINARIQSDRNRRLNSKPSK